LRATIELAQRFIEQDVADEGGQTAMSMIARFVQVKPALLKTLLDDPGSVEGIFENEGAGALPAAAAMENMRKLLASRAPALLAGALPGIDPKMREALSERLERLGVNVEALKSGKGGDALADLLMSRFGQRKAPAAAGSAPQDKGADISLDKGWHGVHYLLCGTAEPNSTVLGQAVMGGTEIGEDFGGYGEARYFTPDQVAATARELGRANLETEMKTRFDPARMLSAEIYPGGWDVTGADWLFEEFCKLRDFYADASANGFAVLICIL
jgi:Domain of unknown function (DUF1877)